MKKKGSYLLLGFKFIFLFLAVYVLYLLGSSPFSEVFPEFNLPADQTKAGLALLVVAIVDTAVFFWLIMRSRYHGLWLILVMTVVFYTVKTFMSQIEAWYFMGNLTPEMIPALFLMTVPVALVFPALAVLLLGRWNPSEKSFLAPSITIVQGNQLLLRLAFIAVILYPAIFFGFGYFVAWQNPELRAFYNGPTLLPGFIPHMKTTLLADPWILPLEFFRGLVWAGVAMAVMANSKGKWIEAGLLVAVLFSIFMNIVHIVPNPLMPPSVSYSHFIETASSNFIFGFLCVWILKAKAAGLRYGGGY